MSKVTKDGWHEEENQHVLYIQNNAVAYVEKVRSSKGEIIWLWAATDYCGSTWSNSGDWHSKGGEARLGTAKEKAEESAARILRCLSDRLRKRTDFNGEEPKEEEAPKKTPAKIDTPFGDLIVFPGGNHES